MLNKSEISLFMFILKNVTLKVTFITPPQYLYTLSFVYENKQRKDGEGEKKSERRAEACKRQPEVVRESVRM